MCIEHLLNVCDALTTRCLKAEAERDELKKRVSIMKTIELGKGQVGIFTTLVNGQISILFRKLNDQREVGTMPYPIEIHPLTEDDFVITFCRSAAASAEQLLRIVSVCAIHLKEQRVIHEQE